MRTRSSRWKWYAERQRIAQSAPRGATPMPVRKQHDLPRSRAAEDVPNARPQVPTSESYVAKLAELWVKRYRTDYVANAQDGARQRASFASLRCNKALAYALSGTKESTPMDLAALWRVEQGTLVHNGLQSVLDDLPKHIAGTGEMKVRVNDDFGATVDFTFLEYGAEKLAPYRLTMELKT